MSTACPCPVCGSASTGVFLRRPSVPVHQNLLLASRQDALEVSRGDLTLTVCHECGFIFNGTFDANRLSYGAEYDNTQTHSPYFERYLSDLAGELVSGRGLKNSRIVEVGCGKGQFLRLLVEDERYGNTGVGFDPSYAGPESELGGRLLFKRRFYDESCADVSADAVVCRHVIEHVPQPMELLHTIRRALGHAHSPRIFFETPCVEWILRNRVIWDFFYEHCSLFTASSLRTALERGGFTVQKVRHVFGGQYLWLEGTLADKPGGHSRDAGEIPALGRQFAMDEEQLAAQWHTRIVHLAEAGKVAVWGAGAKGTTFAHLADPEARLIDCLVDLNPNKQGKFVPGTGHPIVGVEALTGRGVRTAALMNPNYREENEALLAAAGISIQLVE